MKAKHENQPSARADRLLQEHVHDTYKSRSKPAEPTVCPVCKAVFLRGRWQWADSWPLDAHQETCPACHRTRDDYPAGEVILTGAFQKQHREEILGLFRHLEQQENADHPLHRIMKVDEQPDALVVKTTDIHLPHRLGQALHDAYAGGLDLHYDQEGCFLRVKWNREH